MADTTKKRLDQIKETFADLSNDIDIAILDLIAMVEEKDLYIKGLEDELKLYTEDGPWRNAKTSR